MTKHDEMIAVIEAHKKDWESVECSDERESWWVAKELHLVLVAKHHRIIPPKPKMVKWYGYDDNGYVRLSTQPDKTYWKRVPNFDCELPE